MALTRRRCRLFESFLTGPRLRRSLSVGKDAADKLADLRAWLAQQTFTASSPREDPSAKLAPGPYYLLSSLNPIAWFLNLRGCDIAYDPVFYAYVLVSPASFTVWLQAESVGDEVREAVERVGGEVRAYGEAMREIPERVQEKGGVLVTDGTVSWAVADRVGQVSVPSRLCLSFPD